MDNKVDTRTPEQKFADLLNDPLALKEAMNQARAEQDAEDDKGGDGAFAVPETPIDL